MSSPGPWFVRGRCYDRFMAVRPQKQTVDDWLRFPDDGIRRELIDGEVLVAASPTKRHQRIASRLWKVFEDHRLEYGGGEAYADVNLVLSEHDVVEPDLIFVHEDDRPDDPLCFHGPPALVVEVVSDAARDFRVKKDLYERFGVPEYWAVLPDADRVEVYRMRAGRYLEPLTVAPPDTVSPVALPTLTVDLAYVLGR